MYVRMYACIYVRMYVQKLENNQRTLHVITNVMPFESQHMSVLKNFTLHSAHTHIRTYVRYRQYYVSIVRRGGDRPEV